MNSSRVGEQFELELFPGSPWGGRSPRALTKGRDWLFSRRKPPRHGVLNDPDQLDLFRGDPKGRTEKKASRAAARGAPLLVGLSKTRMGREFLKRGALWLDVEE